MVRLKRLRAILRCLYHAAEPPALERWRTGTVHYQDGGGEKWTWAEHALANLREVCLLVTFKAVDKTFHRLE